MIHDVLLKFSDSQALTATAVSTNVIPLTMARNIADGEPMALCISVSTAADMTTGDETYAVTLQTDSADTFGSAATLMTQTIPGALLKAGAVLYFGLGSAVPYEEFLRLSYTLGGATPSVTLDAMLVPQSFIPKYAKYYASGFTIA